MISFKVKDKVKKDDKVTRVRDLKSVPDEDFEPTNTSANVRFGINKPQAEPEIEPPVPPKPEPVNAKLEYFKSNYLSVFGMESLFPSNKDVLMLNLLYSIYSELVSLREDLAEISSVKED